MTVIMETISIGDTSFETSRQSVIATGLIAFASLALISIRIHSKLASTTMIVMSCVLAFAYAIIAGYTVNCMVVGKCIKLSWAVVSMYAFLAIIYAIIALKYFSSSERRSYSPYADKIKKLTKRNREFL